LTKFKIGCIIKLVLNNIERSKMSMKIVLVTATVLMLSGCGWYERDVVANITGYSKICVEGVTYLQFFSGATPQVNLEGRPVACK
jgi:hypothetical protein